MTSLRNRLFPALAAAFVVAAIAVAGCGSSNGSTADTESTTTTVAGDTTTTKASATTASATTAKPVTTTTKKPTATNPPPTNPPPTNPPTTAPQIFTSWNIGDTYACTDPTAPFQPPPPTVTISWTVVGADSVNLLIDGGLWGSYGLSSSDTLPASCDQALHNVHSYSIVAIKNGQAIATKSATRGY